MTWTKFTFYRDNANYEMFDMRPLIETFTMMTSSKWKMVIIELVENCLSYNISKFWRKLINIYRDTINFTYICWRHNMQIRILSSKAIVMMSRYTLWPNETLNHISDSYSISIWKKIEDPGAFQRAIMDFV